MAKHAKPTIARTLSRNGARAGAALAVTAAGLLAAGPIASAGEAHGKGDDNGHHNGYHKGGKGHHKGDKGDHKGGNRGNHNNNDTDVDVDHHESSGVINVSDNDVLVPVQVCHIEVPILAVLVEDITVTVPIIADDTGVKDVGDVCVQGDTGEDQESDH